MQIIAQTPTPALLIQSVGASTMLIGQSPGPALLIQGINGPSYSAGAGISIDDSVISLDMPDALSGLWEPYDGEPDSLALLSVVTESLADTTCPTLFLTTPFNGRERFKSQGATAGIISAGWFLGWNGTQWVLSYYGGGNSFYSVTSTNGADDPVNAVWGTPSTGTGTPIFERVTGYPPNPLPSYIGQLYRIVSSGLWYRWNGTGWDADKVLTAGTGISITGSVISASGSTLWNYRGEYGLGDTYAVGDVVMYEGEAFYRKNANGGNTGDTPFDGSSFWDLRVGRSGFTDYGDLNNLPTLGTAAATDITNYVTTTGDQDGTVGKPAISGVKRFNDPVHFQGASFNQPIAFNAEAGFNAGARFNSIPVFAQDIVFDTYVNGGEFEAPNTITLRADEWAQYADGDQNAIIYLPIESGTLATTNDIKVTSVSGTTNRVNVATSEAGAVLITLPNVVSGLTSVSAKAFIEGVYAAGAVGGIVSLVNVAESVITATLTSSSPATFALPTPAAGKSIIFHLKQAATPTTASFTDVIWSGGVAPVITATAGKVDILSFAAGPNLAGTGYKWYGSFIQNFSPA